MNSFNFLMSKKFYDLCFLKTLLLDIDFCDGFVFVFECYIRSDEKSAIIHACILLDI